MGKFQSDAQQLLKAVGGKENTSAVSHYATQMRSALKDPKKADVLVTEDIPSVKGTFINAGQFQVIIGNEAPQFYNDSSAIPSLGGVLREEGKATAKGNLSPVQRVVSALAEIFTPLIPTLVIGGLILGFRNILKGVLSGFLDGQTIVEVSQFWNGVNSFLWLIDEAISHFLPVRITWSITKKMGTIQILGIILGITSISPRLLNAYSAATTKAAEVPFWDLGFAQVNMIGYQTQVIPAMLAGFLLAYLEIFLRKVIPQAISVIFVPLFALVPTVLAAHVILGPVGWTIGNWVSDIINAGLTSTFNWLFGAVFGFMYAPLVIIGLYHTSNAIDLQLVTDFQSTNLRPMIALSNTAQGSAVLAIIFMHCENKKEERVSTPAIISCYLGVTEPAMFGINLKYVYPFVASMVGSVIAGIFTTLMGVRATSIGVGGLPGILSIVPQYYLPFLGAVVIVITVPMDLTYIFRKKGIFNKVDPADETTRMLYNEEGQSLFEVKKNS